MYCVVSLILLISAAVLPKEK